jgi:hypothetical protein
MANLVLPSKEARQIIVEGSDDYEVIKEDIVETWRWGNLYETIIKDKDGNFWGVTFRVQEGDNYHHEFEDLDEVEFYSVVPKEITTVVYKRA